MITANVKLFRCLFCRIFCSYENVSGTSRCIFLLILDVLHHYVCSSFFVNDRFFIATSTVISFHCSSTVCWEKIYHLLYAQLYLVCVYILYCKQDMSPSFVPLLMRLIPTTSQYGYMLILLHSQILLVPDVYAVLSFSGNLVLVQSTDS